MAANNIDDETDESLVQFATRVPATLLRAVRLRCVERDVTVKDFVAEAVRDKLRRTGIRRL